MEGAIAGGLGGQEPADILGDPVFLHVHPDHPLGLALERMGASGHKAVPVVSRADVRELLGVLTLDDILKTYGVRKPDDQWGERG
jgi:CBS domain-containing protein